jgi:ubiquinone/menaquinone biosynthesis C-methylase UbiE
MRLRTDYDLPEIYDLRTQHITEDIDFLRLLFPVKDTRLLEIGCGSGRILAALAADGYSELTGVEVTSKMLDAARLKLQNTAARLFQLDVAVAWARPYARPLAPWTL